MPLATVSIAIEDNSKQTGRTSINLPDVLDTYANISNVSDRAGNVVALIQQVIVGEVRTRSINLSVPVSGDAVTNIQADRGVKWQVKFVDNTPNLAVGVPNPGFGRTFVFEIPTADRTLLAAGTDFADLSAAPWVDWVADMNQDIRSPYNRAAQGVPVTNSIVSIGVVNRD